MMMFGTLPDSYGTKLTMPVPESEDKVTYEISFPSEDEVQLISTSPAGKVITEKYVRNDDCSLIPVSGMHKGNFQFNFELSETCIAARAASTAHKIVLQRGLGGSLQMKAGQSFPGSSLEFLAGGETLHT